jgi:hypothetical protein
MAETQKKAIVRLFNASTVSGYLPPMGFTVGDQVSLMDTSGISIPISINDIKLIAYVRDFISGNSDDPDRLGRRSFPARPRTEGLWLRLTFRDGDILEGLAASDITFLDSPVIDRGLTVTPPDARSNTQRLYVPRSALTGLQLLGVISSAARRKLASTPPRETQPWLFGDS